MSAQRVYVLLQLQAFCPPQPIVEPSWDSFRIKPFGAWHAEHPMRAVCSKGVTQHAADVGYDNSNPVAKPLTIQ